MRLHQYTELSRL